MHTLALRAQHFLLTHPIKSGLVSVTLLTGIFFLWGEAMGIFPLGKGNFLFLIFLLLLIGLYRPNWVFLITVGWLPYEIVNLAPSVVGITLRPYQVATLALLLALIILFFARRLPLSIPKLRWYDGAAALVLVGAFVSALFAEDRSAAMKMAAVLLSFGGLYGLTRYFLRHTRDTVHLAPYILSSFLLVSLWSIAQNILFEAGLFAYSVMPGRPNGTFSEPDWLGLYAMVIFAVFLSRLHGRCSSSFSEGLKEALFLSGGVLAVIILLLSVSRSAWLGAGAMVIFVVVMLLRNALMRAVPRRECLRALLRLTGMIGGAILFVGLSGITRFDLAGRAVSTGGMQSITIACETTPSSLPSVLERGDELASYGCQHIMLEERDALRSQGYFIAEIKRRDPNVHGRMDIYEKSLSILRNHPVFGIGWGNIGALLGTDERGATLNASNMFLEIWLGSGSMGLLGFVILWFSIGWYAVREAFRSELSEPVLIALLFLGVTIFNLFNSGILLALFFIILGIGTLMLPSSAKTL